jgi:hypothetical protein
MAELKKNKDGTYTIVGGFSSGKDMMLVGSTIFKKPDTKPEAEPKPEVKPSPKPVKPKPKK